MKQLIKLTYTELKMQTREPMTIIFTIAFPVFLMVVFGAIFGNDSEEYLSGYGQIDLSIPGYFGMIIGTVGMLGIPMNLANYRENGVLRRLATTPVRTGAILWSHVATQALLGLLGMILLLVAGFALFDVRIPTRALSIVPAVIAGACSFFAIGFVLAGIMPTARAAQAVGMALFYPMLFLSGAAMPRFIMPDSIRRIADALPLTHVVKLIEDLWLFGTLNIVSLSVVLGVLVFGVVVSRYTFRFE